MAKGDKNSVLNAFGLVGAIGLNMAATAAVGFFGGRFADNHLNTFPWFTVIGILLGMLAGLWSTYKKIINQ
ncbi:MAG TPA: AtpZ/AtpI family protein [Methylomusa anaerophila]|uniref:AtpZ/AtpI family protein n=1 Tax=Methylomusa anaerophila TaxID=1930071 RepID=UPI000F82AD62|nr:AtpZ/AtpI family protein [Methylomusa anaerophila]HML89540.1 AtpZ/AtpI family protein [Methylomusa anaerophila]